MLNTYVLGIDQSKENISDCKGLSDVDNLTWQPYFGQNRQKSRKNGHNFSCVGHNHAEFPFEIGLPLSGNSSMTLTYTKDTMATNFGTKIAINAFLRQITRM